MAIPSERFEVWVTGPDRLTARGTLPGQPIAIYFFTDIMEARAALLGARAHYPNAQCFVIAINLDPQAGWPIRRQRLPNDLLEV